MVACNRDVWELIVTIEMEIYNSGRRCVSLLITEAITQLCLWSASDSEKDL